MRNPIAPAKNTPIPRWWKIAVGSIVVLTILTAILALAGVFHINKWGLSGPIFALATGAIPFQFFILLNTIKKWRDSEKVAGWDVFFFGFVLTALNLVSIIHDLIPARLAEYRLGEMELPLAMLIIGFIFLILIVVTTCLFVMFCGWKLAHPKKTPVAHVMKGLLLGKIGWTGVNVAVVSLFSENIIVPWLVIVLISAVILLLGGSLLNPSEAARFYYPGNSAKLPRYEIDSSDLPKIPFDDDEPYDTSKLPRYEMDSSNLPKTPYDDDDKTENH